MRVDGFWLHVTINGAPKASSLKTGTRMRSPDGGGGPLWCRLGVIWNELRSVYEFLNAKETLECDERNF